MIKDGGDLVQQCLLWLFNCTLASHFPKRLSVGLITAVYKSGVKFDMGNYRGITVGSVVAKQCGRRNYFFWGGTAELNIGTNPP